MNGYDITIQWFVVTNASVAWLTYLSRRIEKWLTTYSFRAYYTFMPQIYEYNFIFKLGNSGLSN